MESFLPASHQLLSIFKVSVLLCLLSIRYSSSNECGGFHSAAIPGVIVSPNYPNPYPHNLRCIWVFEAPVSFRVLLTIEAFEGQGTNTSGRYTCNDYIEVRDGSSSANELFVSCGPLSSVNITSSARWLWVLFSSDGNVANSGLKANYSVLYAGDVVNSVPSPISACRTYEFSCTNKQCISNSYRCDGYFDCGCSAGCDEDGCAGTSLSYAARLAMGIGIGVCLFICICMFSLLWERRHNWARLNHKDDDKNKKKAKR